MRLLVGLLACAGAVNLALADDPPATPASAPASAATPSEAKPAASAAKPTVDKDVQHFVAEGYKPEMQSGQQVYCRREAPLGTHFAKKQCATLEELKLQEERAKASVQQSQRQGQ